MTPLTVDPVGTLRKALRGKAAEALAAAAAVDPGPVDLPGPTGEANTLTLAARGTVLCLGPGSEAALDQAVQALAFGNRAVIVAPDGDKLAQPLARAGFAVVGVDQDEALSPSLQGGGWTLDGFDAVAYCGEAETMREIRQSLAKRIGPIVPLIAERIYPAAFTHERSVCVDTTAAGGNASLLAEAG
jgi:RHH-type proline utilization regulon transcriptional repressor/proline dehydrogenase/delta 1-pyrroline-5-carboxylate dehydrogenase